jgi:hypothetical protein
MLGRLRRLCTIYFPNVPPHSELINPLCQEQHGVAKHEEAGGEGDLCSLVAKAKMELKTRQQWG